METAELLTIVTEGDITVITWRCACGDTITNEHAALAVGDTLTLQCLCDHTYRGTLLGGHFPRIEDSQQ